jgi:hypothetical protein
MGVKLMVEVLDHAPSDWTQSERLIVVAIAEQANDKTRRGFPGIELIAHRAGVDVDTVSRTLRRMAKKGTELRLPAGTDKLGRTVYAHRSHRTVYEIPKLCPMGDHQTSACLERADGGPAISAEGEPAEAEETPDAGPPIAPESPDPGPAISQERADGGPQPEAERPDGGPERADGGPQRPDGGPALPLNPLTSPQGGVGGDRNPSPPPASPPAGKPSQPSLISLHSVKLPEAVDLIYRWGLWNGYRDTTPEEAREVHVAFRQRYGSKPVGYIRKMAGSDGGGFDDLFREVRDRSAASARAAIEVLERTEPDCEHGTRAGRATHPATGALLCPMCRAGVNVVAANGATTDAPVAAVVDAYRLAYRAMLNAAPRSSLLIDITQQAAALLSRGADPGLLVDLARRAGARGEGLITAATRGGQA